MPETPQDNNPFAGLTIERGEALPKRLVAGRESIPNPFVDAVHDSYREAKDAKPEEAVRQILVPVDAKGMTLRTVTRKDKNGKASATQWQQHGNITTALYLLRQAAAKHDIGVRIVVDYKQETVPTVTAKVDDKDVTFKDVTRNKLDVKSGKVRVRFLGQPKKKAKDKASDDNPDGASE